MEWQGVNVGYNDAEWLDIAYTLVSVAMKTDYQKLS